MSIISVISPCHGQTGSTTVAITLASSLTLLKKKHCCLTHTNYSVQDIAKYLNLMEETRDITRSISQVAKLLQTGNATPEELADYAIKYLKDLDIYTSVKARISTDELVNLFTYIITRMPYQHVVIDVDSNITSLMTNTAIHHSDIILITINGNYNVKKYVDNLFDKVDLKNKRIIYIVNNYDPIISSLDKIAKLYSIKRKDIITLHYNPYIQRCCNKSVMEDAFISAIKKDVRTVNLLADMDKLCNKVEEAPPSAK